MISRRFFFALVEEIAPDQFDCRFIGFGAAVTEKHFVRERMARQFAGEQGLGLDMEKVGHVQEFSRLFANGGNHCRVAMAQIVHCYSGDEINVLLAGGVPDFCSFASCERDGKTPIG